MKKRIFLILMLLLIVIISIVIFVLHNNKNDYVGNWIADGTQSKVLLEINEDGTEIYSDEYDIPYDLKIKKDGTYYANFHNKNGIEKGVFKIDKNQIIFQPDDSNRQLWHCEIKTNKEIVNCFYATSFVKN